MIDHPEIFDSLFDQLSDGILIADPTGAVQKANHAARRLLGGTIEHLAQVRLLPREARASWDAVLRGETIRDEPAQVDGHGDPDRVVSVSAAPLRSLAGEMIGIAVMIRSHPFGRPGVPAWAHLDEMARVIASGHDIESILGRTFRYLQPLIGCDNVSLAVVSSAGAGPEQMRFLSLHPTPISTVVVGLIESGTVNAIQQAIETGAPVIAEDLSAEQRFSEDALLLREGIHSYGIYPLRGEQEIIGTLNLSSQRPGAFTERETMIIRRVAAHIALALEKILLIESIERQRQFLEHVVKHAPAGILVIGPPPDFRILQANATFRAFLDEPYRSRVDVVGRRFHEIAPHLDEEGVLDLVRQCFESREPSAVTEFPYRGFARGVIYWNARFMPLFKRTGEPEAVIALIADATDQVRDRRRIEELARTAAQQATALSTIIESMAEGVYVCDAEGQIVLVNQAGARLLGMTVDQALQPMARYAETSAVRYPDGRPIPTEDFPLARALRGETESDWEQIIRRQDTGDDAHVRVAYSPIQDDNGAIIGAVAVASDITRTRQLERQREEFLSIAAHELKTPVTSIKLFIQGMMRTLQRHGQITPERAERDLGTVLGQIERLTELVDDLLDVSRIRTGRLEYRFEQLDLIALVRAVVERFETQYEPDSRHRFRFEPQVATLPATVDGGRVDQVLTNLLSNAVKYSPSGGDIVVRVGPAERPGWIRLSVSDEGIGLTPQDIGKLFQPFARTVGAGSTTRNISGIGLGLYISREIVQRHGGRIWAESDGENRGATFIVEIPAERRRPESGEDGDMPDLSVHDA